MSRAPGPTLNPSGEDANPLNRRLPAECVVRKPRQGRKVEEEKAAKSDEVVVDLLTAIALKPEKRLAWLTKACKMAVEGKASLTELFNILTTRRFASGVSPRVSKMFRDAVFTNLSLFSDKQQRYLRSDEWALNLFKNPDGDPTGYVEPAVEDDDDAEDDIQQPPAAQTKIKPEKLRIRPLVVEASVGGGWVSMTRADEDRQHRHAQLAEERRKIRAQDQEAKLRTFEDFEEKQQDERQRAKKKQLEEDVDSSLQMLELMTQQRQQSPPRKVSKRSRSTKRTRSIKKKSRSKSKKKLRKGMSRSRSISVKRSPSPKKKKEKKNSKQDRASFEEALRQRMEERDRSDTTRIPVVAAGHAQRDWK